MKKNAYKFAYILVGLVIIIVSYFLAKSKVIATPDINIGSIMSDNSMSEYNITDVKVDSFTALANRAFGTLIQIDKNGNVLNISLDNTNQLGSDFYNNNEALLGYKLVEDGFQIQNDKNTGTIKAQFNILNDLYVSVPNDILMSLMYKAYNN